MGGERVCIFYLEKCCQKSIRATLGLDTAENEPLKVEGFLTDLPRNKFEPIWRDRLWRGHLLLLQRDFASLTRLVASHRDLLAVAAVEPYKTCGGIEDAVVIIAI